VRDQVFKPYTATGKITILYIIIFRFFYEKRKAKDSVLNDSKHSLNLICSWFHYTAHSVSSKNTIHFYLPARHQTAVQRGGNTRS
jgi:hypothetical protein